MRCEFELDTVDTPNHALEGTAGQCRCAALAPLTRLLNANVLDARAIISDQ